MCWDGQSAPKPYNDRGTQRCSTSSELQTTRHPLGKASFALSIKKNNKKTWHNYRRSVSNSCADVSCHQLVSVKPSFQEKKYFPSDSWQVTGLANRRPVLLWCWPSVISQLVFRSSALSIRVVTWGMPRSPPPRSHKVDALLMPECPHSRAYNEGFHLLLTN